MNFRKTGERVFQGKPLTFQKERTISLKTVDRQVWFGNVVCKHEKWGGNPINMKAGQIGGRRRKMRGGQARCGVGKRKNLRGYRVAPGGLRGKGKQQ